MSAYVSSGAFSTRITSTELLVFLGTMPTTKEDWL